MEDAVTSLAGPIVAQSSLLASLTQRRQMPFPDRQQRPSRPAQSSARVEKSTPLRSSLARRTLHRSNSSMSAHRKKSATARPLSWHASPQASYHHLPRRDMNNYGPFPHPELHQFYPTNQTLDSDLYMPDMGYPQFQEQYQPQASLYLPGEWASGEPSPGQSQQWLDPALPPPMWTVADPYRQVQNYNMQHEQNKHQLPSSFPNLNATGLFPQPSVPSEEPLDKVLVGLGLYDRESHLPSTTNSAAAAPFPSSYQPSSPGKGLKLEESWQPSSPPDEDDASEPATSPVPELESSPNDGEQAFDTELEDHDDEHDLGYVPSDFVYGGLDHHQQDIPYYPYQYASMDLPPQMSTDPYGYGYTFSQQSHEVKGAAANGASGMGPGGGSYTTAPVWQDSNTAYWDGE